MSRAGGDIGGSLGAVCEELIQDTSCRTGRNWATKSEEAPGPAGTEDQQTGYHDAIQPHPQGPEGVPGPAWVSAMAELGPGSRSLNSRSSEGMRSTQVREAGRGQVVTSRWGTMQLTRGYWLGGW